MEVHNLMRDPDCETLCDGCRDWPEEEDKIGPQCLACRRMWHGTDTYDRKADLYRPKET